YYDAVVAALKLAPARAAKLAANWVLREALRWANAEGKDLDELPVSPESLAGLVAMVEGGRVTAAVAKEVFEKMAASGREAEQIVAEEGLGQIGGDDGPRPVVGEVIAGNEKAVAYYRAGKEASLKFLIGQVMRQTRGRANPQAAESLIKELLG